MGEVVKLEKDVSSRFRHEVPKSHQGSLDTRLQWMWNQRFGTVQMIYSQTTDVLDRTAATLILQAIMARDLRSIQQMFQRLEGSPLSDQVIVEGESLRI